MSRFGRFDIVEATIIPPPKPLFLNPHFPAFPIVEEDELDYALHLLQPPPFLDELHTVTDLIQIQRTPFRSSTRRVTRRVGLAELHLQTLCDRVSDLESAFERLATEEKAKKKKTEEKKKKKKTEETKKKFTWTAEIEALEKDRKYKWTAEKKGSGKSYKWTVEIKGKDEEYLPIERSYTVKVSNGDSSSDSEEEKTKKKKKKETNGEKVKKGKSVASTARIIDIEEPSNHGATVLRKVFANRLEKKRGKSKELSPQDAAALIQISFRTYLIRRSQALRALRELAIAKTKLKELRALFNNFSYRRHLSRDAVERQRFSEKIIVLLLTVDAIEGADLMVRSSKKSMVDELEAMLDVVDPQPPGKSAFSRRRTFDMPDGVTNKELAAGIAQVVRMLHRVMGEEESTGGSHAPSHDGVTNKELAAGIAQVVRMLQGMMGEEESTGGSHAPSRDGVTNKELAAGIAQAVGVLHRLLGEEESTGCS